MLQRHIINREKAQNSTVFGTHICYCGSICHRQLGNSTPKELNKFSSDFSLPKMLFKRTQLLVCKETMEAMPLANSKKKTPQSMRDWVLNSRLDVDIIRHTSRGSCVLQMSKAKTNERFSKHHTRKNIFKVTKALKCFDTGSQLTRTGSFVPCWQSPGFRSYIF